MGEKSFLKRLQEQPEWIRRTIVWGVTIVLGIVLLVWWIPHTMKGLQKEGSPTLEEELRIPELQKEIQELQDNLPNVEIPEEIQEGFAEESSTDVEYSEEIQ